MIIQKVINNNVVSTFDSNGKEVILMGKGIGFRKKTGDELDKTKIEKIFTLDLSGKSSFVQEVMAIIQEFYEIVLDTEHPAYQRFATHLQYLETEILSKKKTKKMMLNFMNAIRRSIQKLTCAVRRSWNISSNITTANSQQMRRCI